MVTFLSDEGEESPRNSRNDVSGIRSLDETLEMSVVLRVSTLAVLYLAQLT